MILILKLMNQSEINDSIHYHNEQSKLRKNNKSLNKFSTYSFLYTIQGHGPSCLLTKTQREEKKRRRKEELLLEKEGNILKEENIKKEKGALSYYDDMLSNQTLTEEQRNLFIKMKQKRLNRLKN